MFERLGIVRCRKSAGPQKFEEVDTYSLEDQGDNVVRPLLRICDPGRGTDVSSLTGNPKLLRERWEKKFDAPLREMLEGRLQGGGAKTRRKENGRGRWGGGEGNRAGRKGAAHVRILPSLYFVLYGLDQ